MIIPHIRDIFICGILGHYHKWLRMRIKFMKKLCQAFLKMSQKNFNISPDSSGLFATMGIYPLRYNSIIHVMRLFLNKFEEGSPSPWMIHGRDIRLLGLLLWQVHV